MQERLSPAKSGKTIGRDQHALGHIRIHAVAAWRRGRERWLHLSMRRRADAAIVRELDGSAAALSSDDLSARPAFNRAPQPADPSPARHVPVRPGAGLRQVRQLPMAAGVSLEGLQHAERIDRALTDGKKPPGLEALLRAEHPLPLQAPRGRRRIFPAHSTKRPQPWGGAEASSRRLGVDTRLVVGRSDVCK
jgi:hypothetical protein